MIDRVQGIVQTYDYTTGLRHAHDHGYTFLVDTQVEQVSYSFRTSFIAPEFRKEVHK